MAYTSVSLGGVILGKNKTGICVPIMERTVSETIKRAIKMVYSSPDLLEIRLDRLNPEELVNASDIFTSLKPEMPYIPLLATYRSLGEGGKGKMDSRDVMRLYKQLISTGKMDLLDLEMSMEEEVLLEGLTFCTKTGTNTILSYHDFEKTPKVGEMMELFRKGETLGASIVKIAVMPQNRQDVARLLTACGMAYDKLTIPYVGISMGTLGRISRIGAADFGSCITFASEDGKASAPGQLEAKKLKAILEIMKTEDYKA